MSTVAQRELQELWSEADSKKRMSKRELREILGLTRVLLEAERLRNSFPVLYLYCDWAAHGEISRNSTARDVLDAISDALIAVCDRMHRPWLAEQTGVTDYFVTAFQKIGPRALRHEWITFHATNSIAARALNSLSSWNGIRDALFEGLRERPLSLGELDRAGVPVDPRNRNLYETMLRRARGHPLLVPLAVTICGGWDTAGFDQHSSLLELGREMGGGWLATVRGYCWVVETKPRTHTVVAIHPDEATSDFSHD